MARNPQDINPDDVFPPMNLPDDATPWARMMADRVVALEKAVLGQSGSIQGANRTAAANLSTLSDQINSLILPVEFKASAGYTDVVNVSSSTLWTCTATCNIPPGFTQALVQVTLDATLLDAGGLGSGQEMVASVPRNTKLDGVSFDYISGGMVTTGATAGRSTDETSATQTSVIDLLPTSQIITATVSIDFAYATPASNMMSGYLRINGFILFFN